MPLILSNLNCQTVFKSSQDAKDIESTHTQLTKLSCCFVYVLACSADITLTECKDCVIVVGVCKSLLTISGCENCNIVAVTKAIKIMNSSSTVIHLCVNTRPVLTTGNEGIVFAPYHTRYIELPEHIRKAGILTNLKNNLWNSPMDYTRARAASLNVMMKKEQALSIANKPTYTIMTPKEFVPFTIPFQGAVSIEDNVIELPKEFLFALFNKTKGLQKMTSQINSLPELVRDDVRRQIEDRFYDWLTESGNMHQITDLLLLQPE